VFLLVPLPPILDRLHGVSDVLCEPGDTVARLVPLGAIRAVAHDAFNRASGLVTLDSGAHRLVGQLVRQCPILFGNLGNILVTTLPDLVQRLGELAAERRREQYHLEVAQGGWPP
jgi:hypothetical protein